MSHFKNLKINKIQCIVFLIVLACVISCKSKKTEVPELLDKYKNSLNIIGTPLNAKDRNCFSFADSGAWLSFGIPDKGDDMIGFTGPYIMKYSRWISKSLSRITIIDNATGKNIQCRKDSTMIQDFYPGYLQQLYNSDAIELLMELSFQNERTALINISIRNKTKENLELDISFGGDIFLPGWYFEETKRGVLSKNDKNDEQLVLNFYDEALIEKTDTSYQAKYKNIHIKSGREASFLLSQSWYWNPSEAMIFEDRILAKPHFPTVVQGNLKRWESYFEKVLPLPHEEEYPEYSIIPVKSVMTLIQNWRSAGAHYQHGGLNPSYIGFDGFWAWDSWKHAVALSKFLPTLAKDQIRSMFDFQEDDGMIVDVVQFDAYINRRDTKPPLAAWAVWEVFQQTKDTAFIAEMLPGLHRYHSWWYLERDHDGNGLCEYGSTDGSLIAAGWESGMDNAIRFDHREMVKNAEDAWSLNMESVDLNAYLYAEKNYLANMEQVLGNSNKSSDLRANAEAVGESIREQMYDKKSGYFYDIDLSTKEHIKIYGPEAWVVLWANLATQEQAAKIKHIMMDEKLFNSYIPLPTAALNHPDFDPEGYWRGAVWIDQLYFGIKGLYNYGYTKEAKDLTRKSFNHLEGLVNSNAPIYENYHPLTGKGIESPHFSWSAAHLLLLYEELLGSDK